jgi:hypothetical protein
LEGLSIYRDTTCIACHQQEPSRTCPVCGHLLCQDCFDKKMAADTERLRQAALQYKTAGKKQDWVPSRRDLLTEVLVGAGVGLVPPALIAITAGLSAFLLGLVTVPLTVGSALYNWIDERRTFGPDDDAEMLQVIAVPCSPQCEPMARYRFPASRKRLAAADFHLESKHPGNLVPA